MLTFLGRTKVIWFTFVTTLILTVAFGAVMEVWQFQLVDEMSRRDEFLPHISNLTDLQKKVHIWTTATLDVAYPLMYGAFFIGTTVRVFKKKGVFWTIPAMLVIPTDLAEGVTQVLLLNGNEAIAWLKEILTPVKFFLFFLALIISAIALITGLIRKIRNRRALKA